MRHHPLREGVALSFLLLIALVAVACGGAGGEAGETAAVDPTTAPEATQPAPEGTAEGPADDAGDPVDIDALDICALVGAADAEPVAGEPPTVEKVDTPGAAACSYAWGDTFVSVLVGPSFVVVESAEPPTGDDIEVIDGLGDLAYWSTLFNRLSAVSRGYDIQVNVTTSGETAKEMAIGLARLVEARLP